ncbi:MAG: MFS transporter, partial [Burkholderiales bacterium]
MRDRGRIYAGSFLRALANGLAGVVLGIYLAKLGHSVVTLGLVLSAGLAGATIATTVTTFHGDRFGRRRSLILLGALSAAGGLVVALASDAAVIAAGAFFGMLTGMGKDRGAMLALESAALPSSTDDAGRTRAFAWHAVLQDAGQALGGLFAALPTLLRDFGIADEIGSYRVAILLYAALIAASVPWYATLSACADPRARASRRPLSPRSRSILWKICALFSIDGIGGGFLGSALFSYFFFAYFGATEPQIAVLFLGGKIMSAASHLAAAWLARRIGLVNTMVFTHIPSSLLLIAIPFAGTFWA